LRKLHRRPGAGFELTLDGALVLTEGILAASGFKLTGVKIQQEIDLPGFKGIPGETPALQVGQEAAEAVEHTLASFIIIDWAHGTGIGAASGKL